MSDTPKRGRFDPSVPFEHRFWDRVRRVHDASSCWEWTGHRLPKGYGQLKAPGGQTRAHRISYEMANGPIGSSDLFVCHRCDNPPCVRPSHLFLGSNEDNIQDAMQKGRLIGKRPSERHPSRKLTPDQVLYIREQLNSPKPGTGAALAREFGVHPSTISSIGKWEIWRGLIDLERGAGSAMEPTSYSAAPRGVTISGGIVDGHEQRDELEIAGRRGVAQSVEHRARNPKVVGSNPSSSRSGSHPDRQNYLGVTR